MTESGPTVIFLHLGKTGGMTLERVVRRHYPADVTYAIDGRDSRSSIARLAALPDDVKRRFRLVTGHAHFGLHELLPQASTYFTVLRDPVERVASLYNYVQRRPGHHLYEALTREQMSLADFVGSGISVEVENGQTRLLAGADGRTLPFGACSRELLERARANLETRFRVVGLTERFDETLLLLREAFGWRRLCYVKRNVTRHHSWRETLDPVAVRAIEDRNALDLELYRIYSAEFERRVRSAGRGFPARVRLLRLENACYAQLRNAKSIYARARA